jgi:hypothetical protein
MSELSRRIFTTLLLLGSGASFAGQGFWQDVTPVSRLIDDQVPSIRYFDSDEQALRDFLALAPNELAGDDSHIIELPMPDGTQARYSIVESPIMETALAVKYSEIKTYKVYGIDDPAASGRADISQKGFRAMLQTPQGRVLIDPDQAGSLPGLYMSRSTGSEPGGEAFQCSAGQLVENQSMSPVTSYRAASRVAGSLLEYRLAISATKQYVDAVGIDTAAAMVEITTAINRVNQIYERDLGIRLRLVANNDLLIDAAGSNSGFYLAGGGEKDGFSLLDENQIWTDATIGSGSYDIGHIFTTGGGGVAQLQAVCSATKARGVTGLPNPTGDVFYIDFVSHEIGHQFGAEHTFNGTTGSCGFGNRSLSPTTFEPGSGSTIMAYAGICGVENIQSNSDATFHAGTIEQINSFVTSGGGNSCISATTLAGNPNEPTANAGADQVIPIHTSFQLQGIGGDIDGDTINYQWDQMDAGTATSSDTIGDDLIDNALFRSYQPQLSGDRDFPALGTQVRDGPFDQSEVLPCSGRNLNFRLTVRDNRSGQATDDIQIVVDDTSGPFRITSHNTAQAIFTNSGSVILNWDVANTDIGAVSCANVDIDLLTFSSNHSEFSVTSLAVGRVNSGSALFNFPDSTKSSLVARFRVKCSNNIFYDISDADLVITGTGLTTDVYSTSDNQTFFNNNGQLFATSDTCSSAPVRLAGLGIGAIDVPWILFLIGLANCTRLIRKRGKNLI